MGQGRSNHIAEKNIEQLDNNNKKKKKKIKRWVWEVLWRYWEEQKLGRVLQLCKLEGKKHRGIRIGEQRNDCNWRFGSNLRKNED